MRKPRARDTRSDDDLMFAAAASRDREAQEAFEELIRRHGESLVSQARRLVASAYVDDLVQRTLLRGWRYASSYQGGNVRAWLGSIMRNESTSGSLRPSQMSVDETLECVDGPDDIDRMIDARAVDSALAKLDPTDAAIIRMRFFEELSWSSIARETGVRSAYLVRCRFHQGMRQLRRHLSEDF